MPPLFTVFIDAYHGPELLRRSTESVLAQTYPNVELIIVDNGALAEVREEIKQIADANEDVRVIRFEENQFSWNDPHITIDVCWNAALQNANGEFIFHLSYDDFLSSDYVARMVALFEENPECTSAAGTMVSVDFEGTPMDTKENDGNNRPRYMPGHLMALDIIEGGDMFAAAGDIFTFRRDDIIAVGGYHKAPDESQLFGLVPFGITGFDRQAKLCWCRHEGQLNRQLTEAGWTGFITYTEDLLRDWNIEERWQKYGADTARMVSRHLLNKEWRSAGKQAAANIAELNFSGSFRMSRAAGFNGIFWRTYFVQLWAKRRHFCSNILNRLGLRQLYLRVSGRQKTIPSSYGLGGK